MKTEAPVIRFKEFEREWVEHLFSEYYVKNDERNHGQYGEEKTISVASMKYNLSGNGAAKSSLDNYKVLRIGDIAFEGHKNKEFSYGRFVLNDLGEGIMSPRFTSLRPIAEQDYDFWKYHIHNEISMHKVLVNATKSGTMMNELVVDDFLNQTIKAPEINEQYKIGKTLSGVDELLKTHGEKLDKTIQIRKMLLNQLFAGVNEPTPDVRFAENQKDWKLLSLRDIVTPYTDYLPTPTDGYTRLGIRSHMKGTFYDYVAPSKKLGEKRLQRVKRDNLIVNIVFAWEHAVAITTEEDEGKLVSHRFPQFSFNDGMNPMFFRYALSDPRFRHHLFLASPSGAGRNKTLRIDEMMDYELRVPEYEEQKKIAGCLQTVDELIELYEMELEKIRNVKSACLQGMFV